MITDLRYGWLRFRIEDFAHYVSYLTENFPIDITEAFSAALCGVTPDLVYADCEGFDFNVDIKPSGVVIRIKEENDKLIKVNSNILTLAKELESDLRKITVRDCRSWVCAPEDGHIFYSQLKDSLNHLSRVIKFVESKI